MNTQSIIDTKRRNILITTPGIIGAAGLTATSIPFISSWLPSERAKASGSPFQIDISKLEPNRQIVIEWRSKPVFVLRRTPEILQHLAATKHIQQLRDPDSEVDTQQPTFARNAVRTIREDIFVVIGICTHLGCVPLFRPELAPKDLGADWTGGYFCPCHSSRFDFAGRVLKNVPAPTNMVVPTYRYITDTIIEIGVNREKA